jgi:hypothetical protein
LHDAVDAIGGVVDFAAGDSQGRVRDQIDVLVLCFHLGREEEKEKEED